MLTRGLCFEQTPDPIREVGLPRRHLLVRRFAECPGGADHFWHGGTRLPGRLAVLLRHRMAAVDSRNLVCPEQVR